jgi:UDP-N-acetylglucosamine 2-epimerase (non-hydrolysing)
MTVCAVVGARPNFMKMAPVVRELSRREIPFTLVHTGQHYDQAMSEVFFEELGMPRPDIHLGVGSGSHGVQTARVLEAFEKVLLEHRFDLVAVAGDVNSTMAAALAAVKLRVPVAHIEAGLRSFDREMPEEINRIVTDQVSDILFTTEEGAALNLAREGIPPERIHFVGNCMVDSLLAHRAAAEAREPWKRFDLARGGYALLTLHRPSNVDEPESLRGVLDGIGRVSDRLPVLFPIHPRTGERMARAGIHLPAGVREVPPLPYLEFTGLMAGAALVMTDSGGIQEETTALGVPCLTLRRNTERPVTISAGTNRLVGNDPDEIPRAAGEAISGHWKRGLMPPLWDGHAAERAVAVIRAFIGRASA